MTKIIFTIVIILAVAVGVGSRFIIKKQPPVEIPPHTYTSEPYGITFSYPENYFVAHEITIGGERAQHAIMLAEDTPANRQFFSNPPAGTEAPPTVTITLFQNDLDQYTTKTFVENTNFSNFKLSDGKSHDVTIGGEPGVRYRATGLYENENAVVARSSYVYMFTAFFNAPTDSTLVAFETILNSVAFSDARPASNTTPTSADNAPLGSIHNLPVPEAVSKARLKAAKDFGIEEGLAIVMMAYEKEWPDACIGIHEEGKMCAQVITQGYEVTVKVGNTTVVYHTNSDGSLILRKE